jgi:hypothetical protein
MDEELTGQAPDHEPVGEDASAQVTARAIAGVQPGRMPAIYLGHGAPPLVDDPLWVVQLEAWARALPKPTAVRWCLRTGRTRRSRSAPPRTQRR